MHHLVRYWKINQKVEKHGEKQVQALESIAFFDKKLTIIKSSQKKYCEILDELENNDIQEQKSYQTKMLHKGYKTTFGFCKIKIT